MMKLENQACIEAPIEKVWSVLADLEAVGDWVEVIKSAHCKGPQRQGVGASRVCELSNGLSIKEVWVAWDEGRSFQYEAVGMPLVKRASNRWRLFSENGKTLVKSEAELEFKGGVFSKPLAFVMKPFFQSMGRRTFAGLAYLIETGEPYKGKYRDLPLVPVTC